MSLLKKWADRKGFKHPHTATLVPGTRIYSESPGATCEHYGVYAAGVDEMVDDPYSMGLVTFSARPPIEPTLRINAHGVLTRVRKEWLVRWGDVMQ